MSLGKGKVPLVKVCGVTSVAGAVAVEAAGADWLGLNFWSGSPRCVSVELAAAIVKRVSIPCVGVFVDAPREELRRVRGLTKIAALQLHGEESPDDVAAVEGAFKAVGVASVEDVSAALAFGGAYLLLDARVPGAMPGGTGQRFDWALAEGVSKKRRLILAGGLKPENVAEAVARVRPHAVDVASGVEDAPGVKNIEAVRRFVKAAKGG